MTKFWTSNAQIMVSFPASTVCTATNARIAGYYRLLIEQSASVLKYICVAQLRSVIGRQNLALHSQEYTRIIMWLRSKVCQPIKYRLINNWGIYPNRNKHYRKQKEKLGKDKLVREKTTPCSLQKTVILRTGQNLSSNGRRFGRFCLSHDQIYRIFPSSQFSILPP